MFDRHQVSHVFLLPSVLLTFTLAASLSIPGIKVGQSSRDLASEFRCVWL